MPPIRVDAAVESASFAFSICSLMTRRAEYDGMVETFVKAGFDGDCEYLYFDNSEGNGVDAYRACNWFLNNARGRYIIICHQDVEAAFDTRADLEGRLDELSSLDPLWAVCGNAGGIRPGNVPVRITDPYGADRRVGALPSRVGSLDENFIVVKRSANLAVSSRMSGFHLYATDLCVTADLLGFASYVIDFHLRHNSPGRLDASFGQARSAMLKEYRRRIGHRWITTQCTHFLVSRGAVVSSVLNHPVIEKVTRGLGKRLPLLARLVFRHI